MHVVIFEGSRWYDLAPLTLSRPVFMLLSGMSTLLEKQIRRLRPTRLSLWVRPPFAENCHNRILSGLPVPTTVNHPLEDEPALLVNASVLPDAAVDHPAGQAVLADESRRLVQMAWVRRPGLASSDALEGSSRWLDLFTLPRLNQNFRSFQTLADLIHFNEQSIVEDAAALTRSAAAPKGPFHFINADSVFLGKDLKLEPGCVLDASKGPVVIADRAEIGAHSVIKGPCYLGPEVLVKPLSQIRAGTSIGPVCRVGGEISNSIMLGYSNKSHDGFLGHSYLGKWVNLGAGTTTSNLKNTYGDISIQLGSREIPTGRKFLGSLIGDHTKTAVLTRLTTGTYIGFCCMLAGSSATPRFVPSYTFWTDKEREAYRMDRAIEMTRRVYARRDRAWTAYDEQIMKYVAELAPQIENQSLQ